MKRVLVLGYYVSTRFEAEFEIIKRVSSAFDYVVVPSIKFKMGFSEEIFTWINDVIDEKCVLLSDQSSFAFDDSVTTMLSRNDLIAPLSKSCRSLTYVETYGGFDLKYYNSVAYLPKSCFSYYYNQSVLGILRKESPAEFGPCWYSRKAMTPPFSSSKIRYGLFTKNLFYLRQKAISWRGYKTGNRYFETHLRLVGDLIQELPNIKIYVHPNHGGYRDQELDWLLNAGVREENIILDGMSLNQIDVGVGFSTHSRADLNWFGRPFFEISDLQTIERRRGRGVLSGLRARGVTKSQWTKSASFPFYYGGKASINSIKDKVFDFRKNYNLKQCLDIGNLLLGPDLTLDQRAQLFVETPR